MLEVELQKRKDGGGRKPNQISTKALRLPLSLAQKLLALKDIPSLDALSRIDIGKIFSGKVSSAIHSPLFKSRVQAGVPSPPDEVSEESLDLNEHLIRLKLATFFVRVIGDSMKNIGIFPGSLLVVDRFLPASFGKIVIAALNEEMPLKRLEKEKDKVFLC